MRKLLEEARAKLEYCYGVAGDLDEETFSYQTFRDLKTLIARIDAALAAPEPEAMELVRQVREGDGYIDVNGDFEGTGFKLGDATAADLIADFGKRVPRAFAEKTYHAGAIAREYGIGLGMSADIDTFAKEYNVKIEEK